MSCFKRGFGDFLKSQLLSDFSLVAADGSKHPTHKLILAYHSELFASLFSGGRSNDWTEVTSSSFTISSEIDGHHCLDTIIEYMYSGSLPNMSPVDALRLWGLADYLSMTELCRKLRESFEGNLSLDTALEVVSGAGSQILNEIKPHVLELLSKEFSTVMKSKSKRSALAILPIPFLVDLLSRDDLVVEGEDQVYDFVWEVVYSQFIERSRQSLIEPKDLMQPIGMSMVDCVKLSREDVRQQNARLKLVIQDLSISEKADIDGLYDTVRFARMTVDQLLVVKDNPFLSKELLLEHVLMRLNLIEVSGGLSNFSDLEDDQQSPFSPGPAACRISTQGMYLPSRSNLVTIRAIAVKIRNSTTLDLNELRIALGITSKTRLNSWITPLSVVYGPHTVKANSLIQGEWKEFPIRPFTWKTQENLLVEFSDLNKPNHTNEGSALQVDLGPHRTWKYSADTINLVYGDYPDAGLPSSVGLVLRLICESPSGTQDRILDLSSSMSQAEKIEIGCDVFNTWYDSRIHQTLYCWKDFEENTK